VIHGGDNVNLISGDRLVQAIFDAIKNIPESPHEKIMAVVRAGKIAEAYQCGGTAHKVVMESLSEDSRAPSAQPLAD
jgi:hypothetical protein